MVYRGRVKNGVIIPEEGTSLPEGAEVEIVERKEEQEKSSSGPKFVDRYKDFIGSFEDLPQDFARNHDHYIHGNPKE